MLSLEVSVQCVRVGDVSCFQKRKKVNLQGFSYFSSKGHERGFWGTFSGNGHTSSLSRRAGELGCASSMMHV